MNTFFNNQFELLPNGQLYDRVIVLLKSERCGFCTRFLPIFNELSRDPTLSQQITFAIISAEDESELMRGLAMKHNFQGLPTCLVYYQGRFQNKLVGYNDAAAVKSFLLQQQ